MALELSSEPIGYLVAASLFKGIQILAGFPTGKAAKKPKRFVSFYKVMTGKNLDLILKYSCNGLATYRALCRLLTKLFIK